MHASLTAPSALTAPRMFAVPADSSPASHAEGRAVDSSTLLRSQKAVAIVHNGAVYRLQATKLGKLILTK